MLNFAIGEGDFEIKRSVDLKGIRNFKQSCVYVFLGIKIIEGKGMHDNRKCYR